MKKGLSSLLGWRITLIPFAEIKQRNLSVPRVQSNMGRKSFSLLCPISLEQAPAACLCSHLSRYLQEISEDTSLQLGLSPIDTSTPDSLLMLLNLSSILLLNTDWNVVSEFGFAGDISAIKI